MGHFELGFRAPRALENVLQAISQRVGRTITLNELLQSWGEFVAAVERGYSYSIYDYANDLAVRDLIEEVTEAVLPEDAEAIRRVIDGDDNRFRDLTTPLNRPIVALETISERRWWYYRVPRKAGDELTKDLQSEGIGD